MFTWWILCWSHCTFLVFIAAIPEPQYFYFISIVLLNFLCHPVHFLIIFTLSLFYFIFIHLYCCDWEKGFSLFCVHSSCTHNVHAVTLTVFIKFIDHYQFMLWLSHSVLSYQLIVVEYASVSLALVGMAFVTRFVCRDELGHRTPTHNLPSPLGLHLVLWRLAYLHDPLGYTNTCRVSLIRKVSG